ncbi:hypothetical protein G0Q06_03260 [Puniceicoccales bacterium CK1056]|uniref:Uncharacterized protein n=1 Tax=Oceanipulchritudo coccoides TaxID=2706888 RepID=A0A6B2LZ71_9BACT|nr:hypothetical protein [Oceanipulchritudo coccoides]NDV61462.1 hypothetical protein [Oceanipulchritudo coccoides]
MSTTAAKSNPPEFVDFPDPRPAAQKKQMNPNAGLSIDAILQRTHPTKRPGNSLIDLGVEECFASLEAEEDALRNREREVAKLRAEADERVRAVRETEILLDARERILNDREAVLAKRLASTSKDGSIAALDESLKETRHALGEANEVIIEKDQVIAALRKEMEELKSAAPVAAPSADADQDGPLSYDDVTHKSLSEQVAFLREREAFIEQSENTLFDKAQTLQEWETRLQQEEHDQDNAPEADNTSSAPARIQPNPVADTSDGPIDFKRAAY